MPDRLTTVELVTATTRRGDTSDGWRHFDGPIAQRGLEAGAAGRRRRARPSQLGKTNAHLDVWVIEPDGSQRAADFVGEGELSAWFGGSPTVIVVYLDTRSGEAVEVDRVIPRDP